MSEKLIKRFQEQLEYQINHPNVAKTGRTTKMLKELLVCVKKVPGDYLVLGITTRQAEGMCEMFREILDVAGIAYVYAGTLRIEIKGTSRRGYKTKILFEMNKPGHRVPIDCIRFVDHTVDEAIVADGLNKIANHLRDISGE